MKSVSERVYCGVCRVCKKTYFHEESQGKAIYCADCEIYSDGSLTPRSVANAAVESDYKPSK